MVGGGLSKNPLCGGGLDIFLNYTYLQVYCNNILL